MRKDTAESKVDKVSDKVDQLTKGIERIRLIEFGELLDNPRRLFMVNFMAGVARGLGMAVGFTVLAAVLLLILQRIVRLNLPIIGGFIAEIVRMVQQQAGP
jgi:hypothetical protein